MKVFLLSFLLFTTTLRADEYLETDTHLDVYNKASELRLKHGAANVLVVFDIDNTLLKARQPLGSDQWFEWQSEAIKSSSGEAIFRTFDELLSAQADFFQLSAMALTESNLPQIVATLKRNGHRIILLTSRGPSLRNVTERELERNKLWFANSSIMPGIPSDFLEPPFKQKVSFMNGIFMTSGHHKGEALAYLLRRAGRQYKALVFADDHERHTKRVYETFSATTSGEVVTFRYGHEDESVAKFKASSKSSYNSQATGVIRAYRSVFQ